MQHLKKLNIYFFVAGTHGFKGCIEDNFIKKVFHKLAEMVNIAILHFGGGLAAPFGNQIRIILISTLPLHCI